MIDLNQRLDWPRWHNPAGQIIGGGLMAGAVAVWLYCSRLFSRIGKGTPFINEPPKHLVTSGLYSHSRNPIYVAHVAFLLGWFLGSGWRGAASLHRRHHRAPPRLHCPVGGAGAARTFRRGLRALHPNRPALALPPAPQPCLTRCSSPVPRARACVLFRCQSALGRQSSLNAWIFRQSYEDHTLSLFFHFSV